MLIAVIKEQRKKRNSSLMGLTEVRRVLLTFRVLLVQKKKKLLNTAELPNFASRCHYCMVVTAHLSTLITHGLLDSMFRQCTGNRHLSMSPASRAQISWQQQQKSNNWSKTKHWEMKHQRHWQMAVMLWQQLTWSHTEAKLCSEQTAKVCHIQGLSKEKQGKGTTNPYLSWRNINLFCYCGGQCMWNRDRFELPVWDADLD